MITAVLYLLANFGFAYIVGFSKISSGPRELLAPYMETNDPTVRAPGVVNGARHWLVSLLECPSCVGFWTGGSSGVLLAAALPADWPSQAKFIFFGCVVAGSNLLLARAARLF